MVPRIGRLKKLYSNLLGILKKYGTVEIDSQIRQVSHILEFLEGLILTNENEGKHISKVKSMHESLFPPRGGLSEFFIWSNDYDERIKLNEPLENIKKEINDIFKSNSKKVRVE